MVNSSEDIKWIKQSAEQGWADAQCILGEMYLNGLRVPKNQIEALKWLTQAAAQKHRRAISILRSLGYK